MGCVFALLGMICPRLFMVFILVLTNWFGRAYETTIWPLLGFFFMPLTTLAYMAAAINTNHQVTGGWLALVVIAAIIDVAGWGSSGNSTVKSLR